MYNLTHSVFDASSQELVRDALHASPYLGASPLGPEFVQTKGFSIMFRREHLGDVLEQFPYLEEFLNTAIFSASNAFYVNPVVMVAGSRIDAHIDCRLLERDNLRLIPSIVSIFYVTSTAEGGGDFNLRIDEENIVVISPQAGDLLHFRGNLLHWVDELRGYGERVSVVCEQYNLADPLLKTFPQFAIIQDADLAPRIPGYRP